eukprot:3247238-Rhodomonas_salina.3
MFLKDTDNVETLRAMLTWCASAKQWDCDAIPRDIINQHKNKSEADTETEEKKEEMWTLGGEPETYENATHKAILHQPWEVPHSEEEVDFEQAATQDTTVHEDESKAARIELMFGPIVLQDGYTLAGLPFCSQRYRLFWQRASFRFFDGNVAVFAPAELTFLGAEYGVESGSFVHPIYGLRPKEVAPRNSSQEPENPVQTVPRSCLGFEGLSRMLNPPSFLLAEELETLLLLIRPSLDAVSYTHLRAHETEADL